MLLMLLLSGCDRRALYKSHAWRQTCLTTSSRYWIIVIQHRRSLHHGALRIFSPSKHPTSPVRPGQCFNPTCEGRLKQDKFAISLDIKLRTTHPLEGSTTHCRYTSSTPPISTHPTPDTDGVAGCASGLTSRCQSMSRLDPGHEKGPTRLRRLGSDVSLTAGNRGIVRSMTVSSA